MSTLAIQETLKQDMVASTMKTKRSMIKVNKPKESKAMSTQVTPIDQSAASAAKMTIQKKVFDLEKFDDLLLKKQIDEPKRPKDIDEALVLVNQETEKLMDLIWIGLKEQVRDKASEDITGFMLTDDQDEITTTPYQGQYADAAKTKLISAAVLSIAKMQGDWTTATKDEKDALRASAKQFLRDNPKMLKSLQS